MGEQLNILLLRRWDMMRMWGVERILDYRKQFIYEMDGKVMAPINRWPKNIRMLLFQQTGLRDVQTFQLALFFIGNGFSTEMVGDLVLTSHALDQRHDSRDLIRKRTAQLVWIDKNTERHPEWRYFDLIDHKILHFNGNVYRQN